MPAEGSPRTTNTTTPPTLSGCYFPDPDLWKRATADHAFLKSCGEGTVTDEQFNRWLAQDFYFVKGFKVFVEQVLSAAPPEHQEVIAGGVSALDEEIVWFVDKARERHIDLEATGKSDVTRQYVHFLKGVAVGESYAVQVATLYLVEAVYMEAWSNVKKAGAAGGRLKEFAERWSTEEFKEYVKRLRVMATEAYWGGEAATASRVEVAVKRVLEMEVQFWSMAMTAPSPSPPSPSPSPR